MTAEAKIPGIKAKHAIVTPVCRANKGPAALTEAVNLLVREYEALAGLDANSAADFHFVLTVNRPVLKGI